MIISNTSKSIPMYVPVRIICKMVCESATRHFLLILRLKALRIASGLYIQRITQTHSSYFKTFSQVFELIIRLIAGKQKQAIMRYCQVYFKGSLKFIMKSVLSAQKQ